MTQGLASGGKEGLGGRDASGGRGRLDGQSTPGGRTGSTPVARFEELARSAPARPCAVVDAFSYSRIQILTAADALAAGLRAYGVGPGDRIAINRRNAPIHLVAFLAACRIGAALVPLNFRLPALEAGAILRDAACAAVICGPRHARQFDEALELDPSTLWIVDDIDPSIEPPDDDSLSLMWHPLSEIYRVADGSIADSAPIGPDDLAMILYTSGSTGLPKGVTITHGNLAASWAAFEQVLGLGADEVCLAIAPFGHVGGINTFTLSTMLAGGLVVVQRKWDVGDALRKIEEYGVTRAFGVPTMYDAVARHPDFPRRDLSSLKTAIVGGATCPAELMDIYRERSVPLVNSWGMTETSGGATLTQPSDMVGREAFAGRACPGLEIDIVGDDGAALAPGEVGELRVRGPMVTRAYWGREPDPRDGFLPGGWLRTGDLASVDEDGYLLIAGRSKDLIISGGENIFPAEIERHVRAIDGVEQAVVVGAPDERWGECPVAFVVASPGRQAPGVDHVRELLSAHLAKYKLPREVIALSSLPQGKTGKVDVAALREMAAARHEPGPAWFDAECGWGGSEPGGPAR
ncbi:MAG: class I adenylate-forming enzyme family protein [Actinomycetaceae bacterium]|nr:class I adenylate-forming enzyme family protein [Actinomycetaceae bacterium]